MDFFHGIVALLAGIILVLTGMVAWLYVQQSRMAHAINAIAIAITAPPPSFSEHVEPEPVEPAKDQEQEHDDRVTVHDESDSESEEGEVVGEDMIDLRSNTVSQLREILSAKGIPFNKSDKKPTLISLVQAAS
jgi:hypothetical protein